MHNELVSLSWLPGINGHPPILPKISNAKSAGLRGQFSTYRVIIASYFCHNLAYSFVR
jgi:hypothetical protein